MAPLPGGYHDLLHALLRTVSGDDRIAALWVSGSVARGVADAGSDLDVIVTVRDEHVEAFADGWRGWLDTWADVVLARELPGSTGSFVATTRDCLRVDVITESVSPLPETPYRHRLVLLDHTGLVDRLRAPAEEARTPDLPALGDLVEEFLRQQAIFPAAVVGRQDWLLGVVGVHNTQRLLYSLFAASNEPLPVMGVKQWSSRLSPEQREILAALSAPSASRDSVVTAMRQIRGVFRSAGRARAEQVGVTWPTDVDDAVAAYWRREGLE